MAKASRRPKKASRQQNVERLLTTRERRRSSRERKHKRLAQLFLTSFPIGSVFIGSDDFDPWAFKAGLLRKTGAKPGDPTWRQHLEDRRALVIRINTGGVCTTLEHNQRFKIRARANGGYTVVALHQSTYIDFKEMPDRFATYFGGAFKRIAHDRGSVDRGNLSQAERDLYDREGEELRYMESSVDNALAIMMARRSNVLKRHGGAAAA